MLKIHRAATEKLTLSSFLHCIKFQNNLHMSHLIASEYKLNINKNLYIMHSAINARINNEVNASGFQSTKCTSN